jgi:GTP 3',8-cyclase
MASLADAHGRRIHYLRMSITDHCNLNCVYCSPLGGRKQLPRREILSCEELLRVAEAGARAGITKVRITGGEPLLRKGLLGLCGQIRELRGIAGIGVTTNGVFLGELAEPLFAAGVRAINVSLDTLQREKFKQITGHDLLSRVLTGIWRAEAIGFAPLKINMVVMRGVNDDEVEDFARLTLTRPWHVRFIELMPTAGGNFDNYGSRFVPVEEILKRVKNVGELSLEPAEPSSGPARLCSLPGAPGKLGFIAATSWHICGSCNRLRLTADGKLRACLFSDQEVDIKGPLRAGGSIEELADVFSLAAAHKPSRNPQKDAAGRLWQAARAMRAIGG